MDERFMKILVYVEPSPHGEWALAAAHDLATGLARTVILLTIDDALKHDPKLLEKAAARFSGHENLEIVTRVRPGPARDAILAESRASSPAITVFPPGRRWRLSTVLRGSRVKKVVHDSPSTVLVARKPVSDHLRRVLVTVSGGPFSETTLLSAQEIASAVGGDLTVLHVDSGVPIPSREKRGWAPPVPHGDLAEEFFAVLRSLGLENKLRKREGMVVNEILAECEHGHYDVLVLGQHLADLETGGPLSVNIAEVLATKCPIPVIVVRPRRWAADPGRKR